MGCATTNPESVVVPDLEVLLPVQTIPVVVAKVQPVDVEEAPEEAIKYGMVFAKTDFVGVLKTTYVQLTFEHLENENHNFQLIIGDKMEQQNFPWNAKKVNPGYFFIELPEGKYIITEVSIPVGSTLATEKANLTFTVTPEEVTYLGTLKLVGTKEKIRLGGVPVIKPGFDYLVDVVNESEEGKAQFRKQYPEAQKDVIINLISVGQVRKAEKEE